MARKRRESPADIFVDLASRLPWWVSLVLALVSYLVLKGYTSSPVEASIVPGKIAESLIPIYLHTAATFGQFVLPFLFCIAAVISLIRSFKSKEGEPSSVSSIKLSPSSKVRQATQNPQAHSTPNCPVCSNQMVKRQASRGANKGQSFWGCSQYPTCKGTRPVV